MILHLAAFTWKDDVTADDIAEVTSQLRDMAAQVPELRSYHCGPNLRVRPSPADFGVAATVADQRDLEAYLDSPAHAAVYERLLGRMIADRVAVQLDLGADAGP